MLDRFFFPLGLLVAGGFVLLALQPWAERPPTGPVSGGGRNAEDVTVAGAELHRFVAGNVGGIEIVKPAAGGVPILRMSRMAEQVYDDPKAGPHIVLAEDVEYALESRTIEVVVEARSGGDFAASRFEADYQAKPGPGGESGWKSFDLTRDFKPYAFTFHTPRRGSTQGYDWLGVRPVAPDKRRTMEIRSIRIHAVGPKDGSPA